MGGGRMGAEQLVVLVVVMISTVRWCRAFCPHLPSQSLAAIPLGRREFCASNFGRNEVGCISRVLGAGHLKTGHSCLRLAKQGKDKECNSKLATLLQKNAELHTKECKAFQDSFDARLPDDTERCTFCPEDSRTLSVSETLLGKSVNEPFQTTELLAHTVAPLFSKEECDAVVKEAEEYAAANGGWQTERHYSHPTTDVLLDKLPKSREWFQSVLPTKVFPYVADRFSNVVQDPEMLRIFDVFVVKYDHERQSYLGVHRDSSLISLTIALNSRADFEGGGMWVEPLDEIIEIEQGHAATFASNIRHSGHRITAGHRYILVGFLLYEGYVEHDRRLVEASQALRAEGKMSEAEEVCQLALKVNPRRQEAWNNLGVVQRDMQKLEEAMESFKMSLDIDPSYQEGWVNLGVCQGMAGRTAEAIKTARKALALNEGDGTAHYNLGCALAAEGQVKEAMESLNTAIELNGDDGEAKHRRGQLKIELGDVASAVVDLVHAVTLMPKLAAAYNDLGVALYENGDVKEAVDAFDKAVRLDPTDHQARENAAALRAYLAAK